eukprot:m.98257 g.98257  ORF g.98257 m.98257 type:complete len:287 (+) comp36974_c0_seq4:633-1493(+)
MHVTACGATAVGFLCLYSALAETKDQNYAFDDEWTDFSPLPCISCAPSSSSRENGCEKSDHVRHLIDLGHPFIVRSVANKWPAIRSWNHDYFKRIFPDDVLVSSSFSATPSHPQPTFSANETTKVQTYYGVFINDPSLSTPITRDYERPSFVPSAWWQAASGGNEWLHWGWAPSGAKRHVDLMCSSRMSVQVKGRKVWKFYPLTNDSGISSIHFKEVMRNWKGTLNSGDAVVWFPGWDHETKIVGDAQSVSISLHFWPTQGTQYERHFSQYLEQRIPMNCSWLRGC